MTSQKMPDQQWIQIDLIDPHPGNPRYADRRERLAAIVGSMQEHGFWPDKPIVARPKGDRYEAIGGNTRLQAASLAGLTSVFCSIQEMNDDSAIIRLAEDNLGDPFNWAEQAIYIAENSRKDSKSGLSRTRLAQACTGKTENAAEIYGRRQGDAGQILIDLRDKQSVQLDGLLNSTKPLTRHLCEIYRVESASDREALIEGLLESNWTISDVKAAVASILIEPEDESLIPIAEVKPNLLQFPISPPVDVESITQPQVQMSQRPAAPVPPITPKKSALEGRPKQSEYNPSDILAIELTATADRVEKLEQFTYELFNDPQNRIQPQYIQAAQKLHIFDWKYLDNSERDHAC